MTVSFAGRATKPRRVSKVYGVVTARSNRGTANAVKAMTTQVFKKGRTLLKVRPGISLPSTIHASTKKKERLQVDEMDDVWPDGDDGEQKP